LLRGRLAFRGVRCRWVQIPWRTRISWTRHVHATTSTCPEH